MKRIALSLTGLALVVAVSLPAQAQQHRWTYSANQGNQTAAPTPNQGRAAQFARGAATQQVLQRLPGTLGRLSAPYRAYSITRSGAPYAMATGSYLRNPRAGTYRQHVLASRVYLSNLRQNVGYDVRWLRGR